MTTSGWLFMAGTWGVILALTVFCFVKIFSKKKMD